MQLNAEVLPAPFGPMTAMISRLCAEKLNPSTALTPPKAIWRSLTSSIAVIDSSPSRRRAQRCRHSPALDAPDSLDSLDALDALVHTRAPARSPVGGTPSPGQATPRRRGNGVRRTRARTLAAS